MVTFFPQRSLKPNKGLPIRLVKLRSPTDSNASTASRWGLLSLCSCSVRIINESPKMGRLGDYCKHICFGHFLAIIDSDQRLFFQYVDRNTTKRKIGLSRNEPLNSLFAYPAMELILKKMTFHHGAERQQFWKWNRQQLVDICRSNLKNRHFSMNLHWILCEVFLRIQFGQITPVQRTGRHLIKSMSRLQYCSIVLGHQSSRCQNSPITPHSARSL